MERLAEVRRRDDPGDLSGLVAHEQAVVLHDQVDHAEEGSVIADDFRRIAHAIADARTRSAHAGSYGDRFAADQPAHLSFAGHHRQLRVVVLQHERQGFHEVAIRMNPDRRPIGEAQFADAIHRIGVGL
jgi:hypothetical protein